MFEIIRRRFVVSLETKKSLTSQGKELPRSWESYTLFQMFTQSMVRHLAKRDTSEPGIFQTSTGSLSPSLKELMIGLLVDTISVQGEEWKDHPVLVEFATVLLDHLEMYSSRDRYGLLVLEQGNIFKMVSKPVYRRRPSPTHYPGPFYFAVHVFENILLGYTKGTPGKPLWDSLPICNRYIEVMLHSRQLPLVLFRWMKQQTAYEASKQARFIKKQACILHLLDITKSAIHLKMVWNFMVKHRQDLLGPFVDIDEPIWGPFKLSTESAKKNGYIYSCRGKAFQAPI